MSIDYASIARKASEYEQGTAQFLADIVSVPSFSGKEKAVVERIAEEMKKIGMDDVQVDGLGNVIGRLGSGKRVIAFDAHIDTVYPGEASLWNFDPFDGHISEGRVWGRGSVDQKGGMAAMVYAAKIIKELDLNNDFTIYFVGSVMEEDCDGLCWQYILKESDIKPEMVVITEPTNLNIYRGHRGRMEIKVTVKGLSCHGSAPERGDNAIYKIARIALEIEKLNEALQPDPFLGKGTVAVTQVFFSSPSQCAVPDSATIQLDRRLTQGETKEIAMEQVTEAAKRAGYDDVEVTLLRYTESAYTGEKYPVDKYYPTWVVAENSPWVTQAVEAYQGVFDKDPLVDKWTFSTNAVAIAGMYGIPCVGFGPGKESEAHAPNESCPVDHLSKTVAFYSAFVARLNDKG